MYKIKNTRLISESRISIYTKYFIVPRDFICADPNKHIISDKDMAIITGLGIAAFQPSEVGGYPIIFPLKFIGKNFYSHITAFIRLYKLLLARENQSVEHIGIRCYSDRILMQIIF